MLQTIASENSIASENLIASENFVASEKNSPQATTMKLGLTLPLTDGK